MLNGNLDKEEKVTAVVTEMDRILVAIDQLEQAFQLARENLGKDLPAVAKANPDLAEDVMFIHQFGQRLAAPLREAFEHGVATVTHGQITPDTFRRNLRMRLDTIEELGETDEID